MKKILAILMSVVFAFTMFGLSGCGSSDTQEEATEEPAATAEFSEEYTAFADAIDMDFVKEVNKTVASFGDDEAVGMRSAGSPAEKETCDYLEGVMNDIGLNNVTVDDITVDGWTFNGANITFTNAKGEEQKIDLGGYQTTIQADNQEVELVYVNRGTEEDYEGLDVAGKLVLFEVNQEEDWWINYPAYQAKAKGALCAIAMREFVNKDEDGTRIGVQDVCGPADAPALAISRKDCNALKKAIKASGEDSIKVTFNADSKVTENATSHNLYGEIPGAEDETIFVFAHMDGYFHAAYDDAWGVGASMGMAKAMIESGFTPDKTIRFCIHGAEEWGREGSEYDWSVGAYEDIMTNHPDWVNGGFAIVNMDGGYTVEGEPNKGVMTTIELKPFVKKSVGEIADTTKYNWKFTNLSTYTEDFQWTRMGIPAISAGDGDGTSYDDTGYHSTYDSWEYQPLDEEGFADCIKTYGKIAIDLDECLVRPFNFTARIKNFDKSLNDDARDQFAEALDEAYAAADGLQAFMDKTEASGEDAAATELNKKTQEVYLAFQDSLLGLDFINVDAIIRHDMYEDNIDYLDQTIKALEAGNIQEAYDEYLWAVDWSWYDMFFDKETCDYMKNQLFSKRDDTWGADLIKYPHADTNAIVVSLRDKYDTEGADVSEEIAALKEIKAQQEGYLEEVYADELAGIQKATKLMNEIQGK
ncbi:MAG: M20/M25/M40 family metallo-hydrolase [Firmicutes bacterium]|nr:M20/M25/M40 family metallo-hydrolase [Bacillota bacterium]